MLLSMSAANQPMGISVQGVQGMGDLEVDTRLEGENGRYQANISQDWEIWGPNGGYVAAIALRAAGLESRLARPVTFACHFLRVARFGAVDVDVTHLRRGRRTESLQVAMQQEGELVLQAMVRTAAEAAGLEHDTTVAPDVPDPDGLKSSEELWDEPRLYPFWQNLEGRPIRPEQVQRGLRAYEPIFREWFRFRPRATFDDPFVDAGRLLLLIDTMSWPAAVQPHPNPEFQAPNLDVAVWFHRSDAESEWLLGDHDCPVAEGGLMGATGRVWSRDRRLLASGGSQLLCVPARPRG
jgi:acyl-CoA thioesterase II